MEISKTVLAWILRLGLAAMFVMSALGKLTADPGMVAMFEQIGLGQWFRVFTGLVELFSVLLMLIPRTTWLGALGLAATMVGAVATHLFVVGGSARMAVLLLVAALALFALTFPRELVARYRRHAPARA